MIGDLEDISPPLKTPLQGDIDKQEVDPEDIKVDMDEKDNKRNENEDLFDKKKRWAKGIQIYKLVGGKFLPKDYDEDIKK